MNRKEFMKKLSQKLEWSFTLEETQDILADYEEYFDTGIQEGKSEEALCTEFGLPKQIAESLLRERPRRRSQIPAVLAAVFIIVFPLIFFYNQFYPHGWFANPDLSAFLYLLIPPTILLLLQWKKAASHATYYANFRQKSQKRYLCFAAHGVQLFLFLIGAAYTIRLHMMIWDTNASYSVDDFNIGFIAIIHLAVIYLSVLLWILEFVFTQYDCANRFPYYFLNSAILSCCARSYIYFRFLGSINTLPLFYCVILSLFVTGIFAILLCFIVTKLAFSRKGTSAMKQQIQ